MLQPTNNFIESFSQSGEQCSLLDLASFGKALHGEGNDVPIGLEHVAPASQLYASSMHCRPQNLLPEAHPIKILRASTVPRACGLRWY